MKINLKTAMLFMAGMAMAFTSCSDDDDAPVDNGKPSVDKVFTQGLPKAVDGARFKVNAAGQLTEYKSDNNDVYTFEYGSFTRAESFDVKMTEKNTDYPDEGSTIYMKLNKQGFVTYALQVYNVPPYSSYAPEDEEWWFDYDKDGHLTYLKRTEGGDEFKVTYSGGDAVKVVQDETDGDHREYTIAYTNAAHKSVVPNKGCIMLFDEALGIDMDEMSPAYYAGLLGKATTNLPMGSTTKGIEGGSSYTSTSNYGWTLNAAGLPLTFAVESEYGKEDEITFAW